MMIGHPSSPNANAAQQQQQQSLDSPPHNLVRSSGTPTDFNQYAYQSQVYANNSQVQMDRPPFPPFIDFNHHLSLGGGASPHNPWQHPQQGDAFAGFRGWAQQAQPQFPPMEQPAGLGTYGTPGSFIPQQSRAQPQFPAIESPALGCSTPGSDGLVFNYFSSAPPQIPSEAYMQQQQQQPARAHSPSIHPRPATYGEYVPLLVRVSELETTPRLKHYIDTEVLKPNYCDSSYNQVSGDPTVAPSQSPGAAQSEGEEEDEEPAHPKTELFIFHVPQDMTKGELSTLFSQYGKLRRAHIEDTFDESKGARVSKGFAFVTFQNLSDAVIAVHRLDGHPVSHPKRVV